MPEAKPIIIIQTDQGQVLVHDDFKMENHQPIPGFVKITDSTNQRVYWFNINAISWIGPKV